MTAAEKIKARIQEDEFGCWNWTGPKTPKGYGLAWSGGCRGYAHRLMFEDARGPIPDGLQMDHLCRNPSCCNPDHLEAVTPAENTRRGMSSALSRARRGQKTHCVHGHAFTPENSYFDGHGNRSCRECRRLKNEIWATVRRSRQSPTPKETTP